MEKIRWTEEEEQQVKAEYEKLKAEHPDWAFQPLMIKAVQILPVDRRRRITDPYRAFAITGMTKESPQPGDFQKRKYTKRQVPEGEGNKSPLPTDSMGRLIAAVQGLVTGLVDMVFDEVAAQLDQAQQKIHELREKYIAAKCQGDEAGALSIARKMEKLRSKVGQPSADD